MHQNIAEGDDLRPWYLRIPVCEFAGQSRRRFADAGKFVNHGAARQFGILESLKIETGDEIGYAVGGSTMSVRYNRSCRIQESGFLEHGGPNQRLESPLRNQIHFTPD